MDTAYISIERNTTTFEKYEKLWGSRGITGIRVDTMSEGIEVAISIGKSDTHKLHFVTIVADDIDFMSLLSLLDEAVDAPILIAVSKEKYSEDEHHRAIDNGAFFYGSYCDDPEKNIKAVNVSVKNYHRVAKKQKSPPDILTFGEILISLSQRKAYVNDSPIALTPQEFDALHILMVNAGKALRHDEIYNYIHGGEYDDGTAKNIVYNSTKRLRQKIKKAANRDCIQTVYDVGYMFSLDTI